MRKIAIHQPNFCPWIPFFYKMAMVDVFVILDCVQFEKNGYQNRYRLSNGHWVTNPVWQGKEKIWQKDYVGMESDKDVIDYKYKGGSLLRLNMQWIRVIKDTLQIKTPLRYQHPSYREVEDKSDPTTKLITICQENNADVYVTNPDAKNKYLDEDKMRRAGIEIEYCKVPKQLQIHTFEAFEKWGVEGTREQILQLCKV